MRKLTYYVASTIDGFVAGPDGGDPTGPGGFWTIGEEYLKHLAGHYPETLTSVPAPAVELVSSDPAEKVRELKRQDGKGIWLIGGGSLAGSLYGEIDELIVKLNPLTLGTGIPLFGTYASFDPAVWELADSTMVPGGAAFLTYSRQK